jgi:hypothetical protein
MSFGGSKIVSRRAGMIFDGWKMIFAASGDDSRRVGMILDGSATAAAVSRQNLHPLELFFRRGKMILEALGMSE